jgi:tetratricopeptide (TPR) repeat protein
MQGVPQRPVVPDRLPPPPAWFRPLVVGLILTLGLLLYGHTLSFPFIFDDHIYLVDNPLMKEFSSFYYQGDFSRFANLSRQLGLDPDLSTNLILRPVTYLTFYLNYLLDGMQTRGFRAVNIAIHLLNALLVFHLLTRLLRHSAKRGALTVFSVNFIALAAALLFLVHPLQIESVTYIVQRFTSLGTLFYLLTVLSYLKANEQEERPTAPHWRGLSLACFVVGLFSKEFLFTAPFVLLLLDSLVLGTPFKKIFRRLLPYFFCLPIIPVLILLTSQAQNSGSLAAAINITNGAGYAPYHYALSQLSVVLTYLRLLLFPKGLNLDWDYPLSTAFWDGPALLSALTILAILGGVGWWYHHSSREVRPALLFLGVLWFFLTLGIDSSIVPLPDLLTEHRSYLPSIGLLWALACGADLLRERLAAHRTLRYVVPTTLVLALLALALATNVRHHAWRSEIAIWKDTTAKSPNKFRPWLNLGVAYCEKDQPKEGAACLRKAASLRPNYAVAYRNLGYAEIALGRYRDALQVLQTGLKLAADDFKQYHLLGLAYEGLKNNPAAEQAFLKAINLNPDYRAPHLSLAFLYANTQQYTRSLERFAMADRLHPLDTQQRQVAAYVAQQILQQKTVSPSSSAHENRPSTG